MKIIDCDRHVIEPVDIWKRYAKNSIVEEYPIELNYDNYSKQIERSSRGLPNIPLSPSYTIASLPVLNNWGEKHQIAAALVKEQSKNDITRATTPIGQILSMDKDGIDIALIYPTFANLIVNHDQIPSFVSLEYTKAYNSWLKDYCDYQPERLKAVGLVSRHETDSLPQQIEKIIDNGWNAISIRPEPIQGKTLGHPDNDEFWKRCEENNIIVTFHGGTHLQGTTVGIDRFDNRFCLHACSHPMEAQMAFISLLEAGVLERHPNLQFAFLEAGCSWVPYWLWRLDNICFDEFPSLVKDNIKMKPSDYFKRQCWVSVEIGEPMQDILSMIGHEKLIFGSDYPHPDHLHFDVSEIAKSMPELTKHQLDDILYNNPSKLFGI